MTGQRKKAYLALLGLAAVGLLIDRLFLESPVTGPDSASAEQVPGSERRPAPAGDSLDALGIPELPFPANLQRFSPKGDIPDLFADPDEKGDAAAATDNAKVKEDAEAAAAKIAGMLQGVFVQGDVQYAVVGGRMLKRGENIDGCTLAEISGTRVKFVCVDREVIATVPTTAGGGSR